MITQKHNEGTRIIKGKLFQVVLLDDRKKWPKY